MNATHIDRRSRRLTRNEQQPAEAEPAKSSASQKPPASNAS